MVGARPCRNLTPVPGLNIRPEVRYTTKSNTKDSYWQAALRFDRSF